MSDDPSRPDDPWSRANYRRRIAWERRIEREGPFLLGLLAEAPERSVLDLGCGSGEHVAWFAGQGARAVGLDRSEAMIEAARDHEARGAGRFVQGDLLAATRVLADEAPFGLVLCLGNVLPHLVTATDLATFFREAGRMLLRGGLLVVQILAYASLRARGQRALPVNIRPGEQEGEEIAFLRLMRFEEDGRVVFVPATLALCADAEVPLRLESVRRVELMGWTEEHLLPAALAAGLTPCLHGDMMGGPYTPPASDDLVLVARRD